MEQQSDMMQCEQNVEMPATTAPFTSVTFCDVQELYTIDSPINVQFVMSSPLVPNPNDHIGLFRIGWLSTRDYIGLVKVPQLEDFSSEQGLSSTWKVTFNAKELTLEDGEFYQFCYLADSSRVQGVSIPFQFVMDDFEIVPDVSHSESNSEQQPGDSFVHAEHPESTMTVSIIQSELVGSELAGSESAEVQSLRRRVTELEEALSRANAETQSCRQENEVLQLKLHSIEADSGKENMKLRNDIENLIQERDEKQQLVDDLTARVDNLESQLAAERKRVEDFEVSFNALNDAKQKLAARCTNLTKVKAQLEADRLLLKKDNENLSRSVAELTSKLEWQVDDMNQDKQVTDDSMVVVEQQASSKDGRNGSQDLTAGIRLSTDDGRWLDEQLNATAANTQSAATSSIDQASCSVSNPTAPSLVDVNGQNYAAAAAAAAAAAVPPSDIPMPTYDLVGPGVQLPAYPFQQTPYPYPYHVPHTWFTNPYAAYVPEVYRSGAGHLPNYN